MSGGAQQKAGIDSGTGSAPSALPGRQVSIDERRRLVAESLRVGNPGNNARALPAQADPRHDCQIELAVDDIRPYENNPRRTGNAKFAEIKESIRSGGIRNPLTVTRRPGDEHFIIEAGGNTRLLAVQQLWSETREERFSKLTVLFRPWRSECHVLTSHLIENELRGEMTFWDKATGIVSLKARLEAEKGHPLSLRQLEDEMKGRGLSINTATLAHCLFATERLRTLGEAVPELSGLDVKSMQPRLNHLRRHAQTRGAIAEAELYAAVFEPVFQEAVEQYQRSGRFSAASICLLCADALAQKLGEPVEQLRAAVQLPARSTQVVPEAQPAHATNAAPPALTPVSTANAAQNAAAGPLRDAVGSPVAREKSAPRRGLVEQIRVFAELTGIEECLRVHAATPLGYYMDALPASVKSGERATVEHKAWWLLALLSGQLDDATDGLPSGPASPFPSDTALLGWLIDPHDATSSAFWEVLIRAREASASNSDGHRSVNHPLPRGDA